MAVKKPVNQVKIQLPGGKAAPGPQLGSSLGPTGINMAMFIKEFNERTADKAGMITPCIISIYADRTFTFEIKTPPATVLIKKAAGVEKGSAKSKKVKAGQITSAQVKEIAALKMADLNAGSAEAAGSMIKGTARSMGIEVKDDE
ncbi:MAG: 50S ribosomal protein L11 [Firmicutes bacterium]|nr:50S ribosomal protein L11 [Bacillota bacterium]